MNHRPVSPQIPTSKRGNPAWHPPHDGRNPSNNRAVTVRNRVGNVTVTRPNRSNRGASAEKLRLPVIVCLATPDPFIAVGIHYDDFEQTTDDEVTQLLALARRKLPAG